MTDQTLRDKIARALFLFDYGHQGSDAWEVSRLDGNSDRPHAYSQADAVLAVLDVEEIRAEALRDLARVLQESLPESPSAAQTDRMKFAIGFLNASAEDPYRKAEQ